MNDDLLRLATIFNRVEALPPLNIAQPLRVKTSQNLPLGTHNNAPDTLFTTIKTGVDTAPPRAPPNNIKDKLVTRKARWARQLVKHTRYNLRPSSANFNIQGTNFRDYAATTLLAQHLALPFYHQSFVSYKYDSS